MVLIHLGISARYRSRKDDGPKYWSQREIAHPGCVLGTFHDWEYTPDAGWIVEGAGEGNGCEGGFAAR